MTFFSKTSDMRSSHVEFTLDAPREVTLTEEEAARAVDGNESVMVTRVSVMCTWKTGGYNLAPGSPHAILRGDQGESVHMNHLTHIPEWLSEIITAGTPTDLWHDAA